MAVLRDAETLMAAAVAETLDALELQPEDAAAKRLAVQYAAAIDSAKDHAWAMRWLAPLLLDVLEALGATPAARKRLTKPGGGGPGTENELARLRKARRGA